MSAAVRDHLVQLLTQALAQVAPQEPPRVIALERPKQAAHGDYACNAALQIAKTLGQPPRQVAERLVAALPASDWLEAAEIAGPGFINLRLKPAAKQAVVPAIFAAGARFGHADRARGARVMVEFVSANPTGPLHVGHGRQAALGDAICSLLASQGWAVTLPVIRSALGSAPAPALR
jgi:arginyl-tRNA synthetase